MVRNYLTPGYESAPSSAESCHQPWKVMAEVADWLVEEAKRRVMVTQKKLTELAKERFGVVVSQQHISRLLKLRGITYKHLTVQSVERLGQPERHVAFQDI